MKTNSFLKCPIPTACCSCFLEMSHPHCLLQILTRTALLRATHQTCSEPPACPPPQFQSPRQYLMYWRVSLTLSMCCRDVCGCQCGSADQGCVAPEAWWSDHQRTRDESGADVLGALCSPLSPYCPSLSPVLSQSLVDPLSHPPSLSLARSLLSSLSLALFLIVIM